VWTEKPSGYLNGYIKVRGGLGKDPGLGSYPVILKFIDSPLPLHPTHIKILIMIIVTGPQRNA
jgi:hypothetical protein